MWAWLCLPTSHFPLSRSQLIPQHSSWPSLPFPFLHWEHLEKDCTFQSALCPDSLWTKMHEDLNCMERATLCSLCRKVVGTAVATGTMQKQQSREDKKSGRRMGTCMLTHPRVQMAIMPSWVHYYPSLWGVKCQTVSVLNVRRLSRGAASLVM